MLQKKCQSSSDLIAKMKKMSKENSPEHERNNSLVGTEEYVSPEILLNKSISYSSDIWSFGIILFQFFYGKTPFKGQTEFLTFENIIHKELEFPSDTAIPDEAKDLISKLLIKDPDQRIGAQDII